MQFCCAVNLHPRHARRRSRSRSRGAVSPASPALAFPAAAGPPADGELSCRSAVIMLWPFAHWLVPAKPARGRRLPWCNYIISVHLGGEPTTAPPALSMRRCPRSPVRLFFGPIQRMYVQLHASDTCSWRACHAVVTCGCCSPSGPCRKGTYVCFRWMQCDLPVIGRNTGAIVIW